ncbi:DUF935 domain-containing protein [Pseudomonas aeruginosa]|uniref:DUF935 domain-containing protein n=1 Tax=Pseudomonas aeruginosa TaxID=287 RepID=UPI003984CE18
MEKPALGREIATSGDGRDITRPFISGLQVPNDSILQRRGGNDLRVYEEILSDAQVKTVWGQRQLAVVSREWKVEAGGDRPIDQAAAEHLELQLQRVGWDRVTSKMLFGVFYGYAVSELIYGRDDRYITLEAIKVRNRRRFRYDQDGGLRLLTPNNMFEGEPCPAPYFWHFSTGADNDDEPYGLGLAHWLYWPVFFKRNGIKFWLIFLDKFGMPTAVGRYDDKTATPEDKAKLLAALHAIQTDSAIIMPAGMQAELLEAGRSGTADYKTLHDTMDATIAKVGLGQVASTQGTPGRLGNDDLQADVRLDLVKADADLVCESFNLGPARWLTEWNFPGAQPPRVYRVIEEPEDITAKAERDEKVFRMSGFKPTQGYVQETYAVEVQDGVESVQAEGTGPTPSAEFAEGDPSTDPAAAMTSQLADAMRPAVSSWTSQLRALVDQADSLEDLRERLLELAPQLSLEQYTQAMTEGLTAAHLAGRNDVQDELDGRGRA